MVDVDAVAVDTQSPSGNARARSAEVSTTTERSTAVGPKRARFMRVDHVGLVVESLNSGKQFSGSALEMQIL